MSPVIHIERAQVASLIAATFPDYTGRKFRVIASKLVTIMDLNWSGGSRSQYAGCTLDGMPTGNLAAWNQVAPWRNAAEGSQVEIPRGACVVKHSISCGKDVGLTFYVHPANMPTFIPERAELSHVEKLVLKYSKERRASYGGKDRYGQALDDHSYSDTGDFPSRVEWEDAKRALIMRELLNGRGAITDKGKNAIA